MSSPEAAAKARTLARAAFTLARDITENDIYNVHCSPTLTAVINTLLDMGKDQDCNIPLMTVLMHVRFALNNLIMVEEENVIRLTPIIFRIIKSISEVIKSDHLTTKSVLLAATGVYVLADPKRAAQVLLVRRKLKRPSQEESDSGKTTNDPPGLLYLCQVCRTLACIRKDPSGTKSFQFEMCSSCIEITDSLNHEKMIGLGHSKL